MSTLLSSLRGHFFKHLSRTTIITANFSSGRRIHLLRSPSCHSFFPSTPTCSRKLQHELIISSAALSTASSSFPSGTLSGDSFTSPSYLSVRIRCQKDVADMLSETLLCFGASSTTVDEGDDNGVCLDCIFSVNQDVKQCISLAVDSIGLREMPSYEVVVQNHIDWIKATQESFQPLEIKEGLWIVPDWIPVPDPRATNIILNPGLAFGTGEHTTTKLCLLLLHDIIKGGESFLDYGTGSGILAIAAIKFGAALSVGFDIDPVAITAARHNASLNDIGPDKFLVELVPESSTLPNDNSSSAEMSIPHVNDTDVLNERDKYDVVIANILLNPLLELSDQIVSFAKPGAVVGLSGIISEQIPCILEHYSKLLDGMKVTEMNDWACVTGLKKRIP
nr:ribosomal protein L11 methyltransferase [Ipomoea batatas]